MKKMGFLFFVVLFGSAQLYSEETDFTTTSTKELAETIEALEGEGCAFLVKEITYLINSYNSLVELHRINPSSVINHAIKKLEESLRKIQVYCTQLNDLIVFEHVIIGPDEKAAPLTADNPDLQQILQSQQQQIINNLIASIQQSNDALEKLSRPNATWGVLSIVGGAVVGITVTALVIIGCYYAWKKLFPFDAKKELEMERKRNLIQNKAKLLEHETFGNAKALNEQSKDMAQGLLQATQKMQEQLKLVETNFTQNFAKLMKETREKIEKSEKTHNALTQSTLKVIDDIQKETNEKIDKTQKETSEKLELLSGEVKGFKELNKATQEMIMQVQREVIEAKASMQEDGKEKPKLQRSNSSSMNLFGLGKKKN